MAVQQSTPNKADAPSAPTAPPMEQAFSGVQDAPGGRLQFVNLLGLFTAGSGVTPEIEAYLKIITTHVKSQLPQIELTQLAEPMATQAFHVVGKNGDRYAYLILFTDALGSRPPQNIPMSRNIPMAYAALQQVYPNCHLMGAVLIGNHELGRARQMANVILGALLPQVNAMVHTTSAAILSGAGEFSIDLSLDAARNFENSHSPHEVRPAADIGFTLGLKQNRNRQLHGGMYGANQDMPEQAQAFMSVTAKVEINGPQRNPATGGPQYLPMIRVTSITSDLPLLGSAILGLVIAADFFVNQRFWQHAFMKFDPGSPNLGHLFPNPDPKKQNEPYRVTNQMELDSLVNLYFSQPLLVLDVQDGHDRLAGLSAFLDQNAGRQTVLQEVGRFFGVEPPMNQTVVSAALPRFEGYYGDTSGRLIDTRTITCLDQMAKQGVLDHTTQQVLLGQDTNPMRRAEVIASLTTNYVSIYETFLAAIDGQFMGWVAQAVKHAGMRINDPSGRSGFVQMPASFISATNYANFQSVVTPTAGGMGYSRPWTMYG